MPVKLRSLSRFDIGLFVWSVAGLSIAEYLAHLQLGDRSAKLLGAIEVVTAIGTGIAFGLSRARGAAKTGRDELRRNGMPTDPERTSAR